MGCTTEHGVLKTAACDATTVWSSERAYDRHSKMDAGQAFRLGSALTLSFAELEQLRCDGAFSRTAAFSLFLELRSRHCYMSSDS